MRPSAATEVFYYAENVKAHSVAENKENSTSAQAALEQLVRQAVEKQGEKFEGKIWAIRPRKAWAEMAGVSEKTVTRVFQKAPFDTLRKQRDGKQITFVRVGKPDPNQPSRLAATMASMFRANIVQTDEFNAKQETKANKAGKIYKIKTDVTPYEYGLLHGLVKDWVITHPPF